VGIELNDKGSWVPRSGEIIAGRYRVERAIGCGGMGAVVSAVHLALGERVALKFLHPSMAATTEAIERFVREARATSRIKSEHVVRVTDVGTTDQGTPFIAMELLEGEDLASVVARGSLPLALAADCVLQAAEALSEAHAVGVVHRDIKPSNLWMTHRTDGSTLVKVLDFGISKLAATDETSGSITATQAVFGSPTYMSPEQIRSAKRVDHRTDVWALGVVLHELLTTQIPFEGESVAAVLAAISADAPVRLCKLRPDLPVDVELAILRCLEKDPARRGSLAELAERLAPYASNNGKVSVARIPRIGTGSAPVAPRVPVSSMPGAVTLAMGATEPNLTTARTGPSDGAGGKALRRLTWAGVALAAVAALTLAGVGFVRGAREHALPSTSASSPGPSAGPDPSGARSTAAAADTAEAPPPGTQPPGPSSAAKAAVPPPAMVPPASHHGATKPATSAARPPLAPRASAAVAPPPPPVAVPPATPTSNLSDDRR